MERHFMPFGLMLLFSVLLISCDSLLETDENTNTTEETSDNLYVKFINETVSTETITSIELQPMGVAGTTDTEPEGEFGENILDAGQTLAPGEHAFFNLEIPNSHYSRYRLGVDDGNGGTLMLYQQEGYQEQTEGTITHWGSHDRTVTVTVVKDEQSGMVHIRGWGDWAGID